eukprot:TRINITY_DN1695_c0_g1_i14.p1 TRINITY_DN1695_c0_g1~~TRINITY_DN1695_c0_g1_i14.p1  ORF type:complete len:947 (+),score=161.28 TRINITY_DN1695_c0_g1_i14:53-2893(+)
MEASVETPEDDLETMCVPSGPLYTKIVKFASHVTTRLMEESSPISDLDIMTWKDILSENPQPNKSFGYDMSPYLEISCMILEHIKDFMDQLEVLVPGESRPKDRFSCLSLQNQAFIDSLFELSIYMGCLIFLDRGVSFASEKNSVYLKKVYEYVKKKMHATESSTMNQLFHLAGYLTYLAEIDKAHPSLHLMSKHGMVIFPGLLQVVAYSPKLNDLTKGNKLSALEFNLHLQFRHSLSKLRGMANPRVVESHSEIRQIDYTIIVKAAEDLYFSTEAYLICDIMTMSMAFSMREKCLWMKAISSELISLCVLRREGVIGMLDRFLEKTSPGKEISFEKTLEILAIPPSFIPDIETFYRHLAPQVLELVRLPSNSKSRPYIHAGVMLLGHLLQKHPGATERHIITPLLENLSRVSKVHKLLNKNSDQDDSWAQLEPHIEDYCISDMDLTTCIEDLHKIMTICPPSLHLIQILVPWIPVMFQLHCFLQKTISNSKIAIKEVLSGFFKLCESSSLIITHLIIPSEKDVPIEIVESFEGLNITSNLVVHAKQVVFELNESGGIRSVIQDHYQRDAEWETKCIIDFLDDLKNTNIPGDVYINVLQAFTKLIEAESNKSFEEPVSKKKYFVLFHFLILMHDAFGPSIMKNSAQVLAVVFVMLEGDEVENITLALGILSTMLCGGIKVDKRDEPLLMEVVPILQKLMNHEEEQVSEMAAELRVMILTRDPSWTQGSGGKSQKTSDDNTLEAALTYLRDPLLPVRGHGLIVLRKLVLSKSPSIDTHWAKIYEIFDAQLRDGDTYIYISAIHGLAAMGNLKPQDIFGRLLKGYGNQKELEVTRLKYGEALVHVSSKCGDGLANHRDLVVRSLLSISKDPSPSMRASAYSNLATVFQSLGLASHPYTHDIFQEVTHPTQNSYPSLNFHQKMYFVSFEFHSKILLIWGPLHRRSKEFC